MKIPQKSSRGFTLIELLVVISIIGMLSSVVMASVQAARDKAQVASGQRFSSHNYHALGADATGIWNFNEGLGTSVVDGSGNGNTGNFGGTVSPTWTTGLDGTPALNFSNGYVQIVDPRNMPSTTNFTVSAWIKLTNNSACGSNCAIISLGGPPATGLPGVEMLVSKNVFGGGSQQLAYYIDSGSGGSAVFVPGTSPALDIGKWYNVAESYSGTTVKGYVNGNLKFTSTFSAVNMTSWPGAGDINIGAWFGNFSPFVGVIDDAVVYTQALSSADIQNLYAAGLPEHQVAVE